MVVKHHPSAALALSLVALSTAPPTATALQPCTPTGWDMMVQPEAISGLLDVEIDSPSPSTRSRSLTTASPGQEPSTWAMVAGVPISPEIYIALRAEAYDAGESLVDNNALEYWARALGGSHFAWFQVVVESPWRPLPSSGPGRLTPPFIDLCPGGYADDPVTTPDDSVIADDLPWYWNHANAPDLGHDACFPTYTSAMLSSGRMFVLNDSPRYSGLNTFSGELVFRFNTYLALLNADESLNRFIPCMFTWSQIAPPRDPLAVPVFTTTVEGFAAVIPPPTHYPGLLTPSTGPAFATAKVPKFGEFVNGSFTQPLSIDPLTGEPRLLSNWLSSAATNAAGQGSGSVVPSVLRTTDQSGNDQGHLTVQLQTHQLTGFPGSLPPSSLPAGAPPGSGAVWISQTFTTYAEPFLLEIVAKQSQPGPGMLHLLIDGVSVGAVTTDAPDSPLNQDAMTTLRFPVTNPALLGRSVPFTILLQHMGWDLRVDLDSVRTIPRCSTADIAGPGPTSGFDGELTADDIIQFVSWFTSGDTRADIAGPGPVDGPDAELTADDLILFINRFSAGC